MCFGEISLEFGWEKAQGAAPGELRVGRGPGGGRQNGDGGEIKGWEQSKKRALGSPPGPPGEPPQPPRGGAERAGSRLVSASLSRAVSEVSLLANSMVLLSLNYLRAKE